jgi:biotin transport system substrate-specific component
MTLAVSRPTMIDRLWPETASPALRWAVLIGVGSLLMTASAKAQVPMWPVPMTMQSFVALVLGMAYGSRLAGATVAIYLFQGAIGLPVFAGTPEKGIGLAYLAGPTGGYLIGFLVSAVAVGWLAERGWDRSLTWSAAAMTIGTVLLFALGVSWLAVLIGWEKAIAAGLVPFLFGSVLKLALAATVLPACWSMLDRRRG